MERSSRHSDDDDELLVRIIELKQMTEHAHELLHKLLERTLVMSIETERLTASVANIKTAADSSNALLATLAQMIRDLSQDPVALNALADSIDSEAADITAAVLANTPAAPAPVVDPNAPVVDPNAPVG